MYQWEWKNGEQWHAYGPELNKLIEHSYQSQYHSIEFNIDNRSYEIRFTEKTMRQVLKSDYKKWRHVRRKEIPMTGMLIFQRKGQSHNHGRVFNENKSLPNYSKYTTFNTNDATSECGVIF